MTGGIDAPTQADPPSGNGTAGDRDRARLHRALPPPGPAGAGIRPGRLVATGPDAQPAADLLRADRAGRGDRGAGYAAGAVGPARGPRAGGDARGLTSAATTRWSGGFST